MKVAFTLKILYEARKVSNHVFVCWGIYFAFLCDFSSGFWSHSVSVIFFVFHFICTILSSLDIFSLFDSSQWPYKLVSNCCLRGYHTLQGDNSLKSVERFDHMMFVCRFQASR